MAVPLNCVFCCCRLKTPLFALSNADRMIKIMFQEFSVPFRIDPSEQSGFPTCKRCFKECGEAHQLFTQYDQLRTKLIEVFLKLKDKVIKSHQTTHESSLKLPSDTDENVGAFNFNVQWNPHLGKNCQSFRQAFLVAREAIDDSNCGIGTNPLSVYVPTVRQANNGKRKLAKVPEKKAKQSAVIVTTQQSNNSVKRSRKMQSMEKESDEQVTYDSIIESMKFSIKHQPSPPSETLSTISGYDNPNPSGDTDAIKQDNVSETPNIIQAQKLQISPNRKKGRQNMDIKNETRSKQQSKLSLVYFCGECNEGFFGQPFLQAHSRVHSSDGPFSCLLCSPEVDLESPGILHEHLSTHTGFLYRKNTRNKLNNKILFACEICQKIFTTQRLLSVHKRKTHKSSYKVTEKHICELCPVSDKDQKSFVSVYAYIKHLRAVHEDVTTDKPFCCSKCNKKFAVDFLFHRHVKQHNLDNTKPLSCDICDLRFRSNEQNDLRIHIQKAHSINGKSDQQNYECKSCNKLFSNKTNLMGHEYAMHPELFVFACHLCSRRYSDELFLKTHIQTHDNTKGKAIFDCEVCSSRFLSSDKLETHLKVHTYQIQCSKCTEVFFFKSTLLRHLYKQHGEAQATCELCDRQFGTKEDLISHAKTHELKTLPATHFCTYPECNKKFKAKLHLKLHMKRHQLKNFFSCEICRKQFSSRDGLRDHLKSHQGIKDFRCSFCEKTFVRRRELQFHTYTHTGEKPSVCHVCQKGFTQPNSLKKHLEIHKKDSTFFPKLIT